MPTTQLSGGDGYLQVRVNTATGALPIAGASVIIYERAEDGSTGEMLYNAVTDESGLTAKFALPAPPASLSDQPGAPYPYREYQVRVQKPRFYPVRFEGVPIFEKISTEQPVALTPVPDGVTNPEPQVFPPYSSTL
ncbi:carboxypeptidase regulatory-like domain-containing protein [Intestinibacillus massiliensis]|uniref:carboxypeptidase-like regulatory domain-containing protein n=1 Tax=Intestinibacillus massiliensis TaxID=1871029 RepID=UPI000B34CB34|nr:carboxypeptidase-like regulatory domain-containing protein [Intestinibacillus massiliensis]MCB6366475.1 carboxypeptidase regulatory-like domain-containing protein [Intestinibacillus massiliensis]